MALTSGFANTLAPGFRDWVGTTFRETPVIYTRLYNVESTARNYEDYGHTTGIPTATTKPEAQPIDFYDPIEGGTKRVTPAAKAIGVQVSRELWDDDLYKSKSGVRKAAQSLSRAYIEAVEIDSATVFNDGFTSATPNSAQWTVDFDTSNGNVFSTSHTQLGAGVTALANRPSTDAALSLTSLRAGLLQFDKWTDDRGNKVNGNPQILLVPTDLRYRAQELLRTAGKPGTDLNDVNVTQGALRIVEWRYLTSSTAWFIIGSPHHWKFLWRQRPMMDAYDDRNTKVAKFTIWGRHAASVIHWFNSYGTTGA